MDFLGRPNARSNIFSPHIASIDTVKGRALVPGDGTTVLGLTYSYDGATFIAKLLDLDEWPEFSCCVGEDTTFNTMIKDVEEVTGEYHFEVSSYSTRSDKQNQGKNYKSRMSMLRTLIRATWLQLRPHCLVTMIPTSAQKNLLDLSLLAVN